MMFVHAVATLLTAAAIAFLEPWIGLSIGIAAALLLVTPDDTPETPTP